VRYWHGGDFSFASSTRGSRSHDAVAARATMRKPTHRGLGQLLVVDRIVENEVCEWWSHGELCLGMCVHRRLAPRVELAARSG
jgi:hypothetical protein